MASTRSGKFKHLKFSENVNFEGTSSVDSFLTVNSEFKWWNFFLFSFCLHMGKGFQKSALPTWFNFVGVMAALQSQIENCLYLLGLKCLKKISEFIKMFWKLFSKFHVEATEIPARNYRMLLADTSEGDQISILSFDLL